MNEIEFLHDNVKALCCEVIKLACKDYISAYRSHNAYKCKAIENWFRSSTFDLYVNGKIDSELLIKGLKDKAFTDPSIAVSRLSKKCEDDD